MYAQQAQQDIQLFSLVMGGSEYAVVLRCPAATYLHGLWAGQASANSDFAAIAWQFKLLGFNAIRLPFLFADLWTPAEMIGGAHALLAQTPFAHHTAIAAVHADGSACHKHSC